MKVNFEYVKWVYVVYLFSFEEYMEVVELEIIVCVVLGGCFMFLGKMVIKEVYEWFKLRLRLVKFLCVRCCFMNDIYGLEVRILIIFFFMICFLFYNIFKILFRKI